MTFTRARIMLATGLIATAATVTGGMLAAGSASAATVRSAPSQNPNVKIGDCAADAATDKMATDGDRCSPLLLMRTAPLWCDGFVGEAQS